MSTTSGEQAGTGERPWTQVAGDAAAARADLAVALGGANEAQAVDEPAAEDGDVAAEIRDIVRRRDAFVARMQARLAAIARERDEIVAALHAVMPASKVARVIAAAGEGDGVKTTVLGVLRTEPLGLTMEALVAMVSERRGETVAYATVESATRRLLASGEVTRAGEQADATWHAAQGEPKRGPGRPRKDAGVAPQAVRPARVRRSAK